MNYKKNFFALFLLPICFFIFLIGYVLYTDVLQVFPKGYFVEEKFINNMRDQNKGIIDNIEFDSVILGTSMLENSSALETASLLGGKWINISMSDSNFYERAIILKYLFKRHIVSSVIYSFDFHSLEKLYNIRPKNGKWPMLYNDSRKDSILNYYDMKTIKYVLQTFFLFKQTKATIDFFDHPAEWATNLYHSCRFGGLENWIINMDKQGIRDFITKQLANIVHAGVHTPEIVTYDAEVRDAYIQYVNDNIISFVKEYPQTNFYILIPPYYRYRYAKMRQVNVSEFGIYQENIRHIVAMSEKYSNLKVYGFEDMPFLDDIANYKDTLHYHQSINSMMNHAIADGTHILTSENIESYLAKCDALAQAFDIRKFYDEACALMVKHGLDPKTGEKLH